MPSTIIQYKHLRGVSAEGVTATSFSSASCTIYVAHLYTPTALLSNRQSPEHFKQLTWCKAVLLSQRIFGGVEDGLFSTVHIRVI